MNDIMRYRVCSEDGSKKNTFRIVIQGEAAGVKAPDP
jgi:hypothetical protein